MSTASEKKNKLLSLTVQLADRLAADIEYRKLKPGDTYFTAQEASRFLGVAGASANKALQLLEKRRIIQRSQRRGAVILEPPRPGAQGIEHVHFLVHDKYYRTEGLGGDGILLGIQAELPTSTVSHCFLSPENEITRVSNLIDRAFSEETTDAFVLVRASYDVQRMIAQSALPAIVYGSIYQGIDNLSRIDRDHVGAIRSILEYLQERRRNRLVFMGRQQIMPGDHQTFDTLLGYSSFPLTFRFMPQEDRAIEAEASILLSKSDFPDAFICHTLRHADCVDRVRRELKIPKSKIDIVVLTTYMKRGETTQFPHIVLSCDAEILGRRLGTLLLKRAAGEPTVQAEIPVKLVIP